MNYVYHLVPPNLTGSALYPLNVLKQKHPNLYAEQIKKYQGRSMILEQKIPPLECLWNDVLHFSPLHPADIRDGLLEAGFEKYPVQWFEVNPVVIFNFQNAAIYRYPPQEWLDFSKMAADFEPFAVEKLKQLSALPTATVNYYRKMKQQGERPLLFHRVPHVLYQGTINLEEVEVIRV